MLSTLTLPYVAERQTLMSCDIQNLITMILVCHFFFYFSQISSLKLQVAQLSNSQCLILLYMITELTLHATADSNLLRPVSETQYVIILGLTKTVQQESFPGSVCQWHCLMEYLTLLEAIVVFTGGQCGSKIIAKLHSLFKNLSAPQSEWQNLILERKIYYPWVALLMQIKSSCSVLKNQCNRDQNYHRYLYMCPSLSLKN